MKKIIIAVLVPLFVLLGITPAQAVYGNEQVYNRCVSERGAYVYNTGYREGMLLLGPCHSSADYGWQDTDYIHISKADICWRGKTASGDYGPVRSGVGDWAVGENTLYIETGTMVYGGWDPQWYCNFSVNGV